MSVSDAFAHQAKACAALGSPFMSQLCTLFATRDWPDGLLKARIFNWPGDISPKGDSVPLRLAGGLHALHLDQHPRLAPVYPPLVVEDDALWDAVTDVMQTEADFLDQWINSAPQTNEVRRSAVLIAVGHALAARYGLAIRTFELGASGGLNLNWDAYALDVAGHTFGPEAPALTLRPDWKGPLPPMTRPDVIAKAAVDLNPLTPANPSHAKRLRAYLWPDQVERLDLTQKAIEAASVPVDTGDAVDWLADRLTAVPGTLQLIYTTVAWQYFPQAAQDRGRDMIEAAGATASMTAPLAWFSMETDGAAPGAALTLRLWPEDITIAVGRADFHGRWVAWAGLP